MGMANVVDSIGFDLERVHTGLIVYLVDLWRSGKKEPLQTFFSELGVELQGVEEIKARKECENIDLVLLNQNDTPLVAVEMKVHNHESLVPVKGSRGEWAYQTNEYPKRIGTCRFLYVTLGAGEYYRRKPYGSVEQVGLDEFILAVKRISDHDAIIKAWEESLMAEKGFREACGADRKSDKETLKKWNLYFLGFLREELDGYDPYQADFTAYRHSQDTILNSGIKKPAEVEGAYCYMEINGNGKLNLKADLESLDSQADRQAYVERARNHYAGSMSDLANDSPSYEKTGARANLTKSRTLISFDIGIEKQDGFFGHTESRERSCERISEIIRWFSAQPVVKTS